MKLGISHPFAAQVNGAPAARDRSPGRLRASSLEDDADLSDHARAAAPARRDDPFAASFDTTGRDAARSQPRSASVISVPVR